MKQEGRSIAQRHREIRRSGWRHWHLHRGASDERTVPSRISRRRRRGSRGANARHTAHRPGTPPDDSAQRHAHLRRMRLARRCRRPGHGLERRPNVAVLRRVLRCRRESAPSITPTASLVPRTVDRHRRTADASHLQRWRPPCCRCSALRRRATSEAAPLSLSSARTAPEDGVIGTDAEHRIDAVASDPDGTSTRPQRVRILVKAQHGTPAAGPGR